MMHYNRHSLSQNVMTITEESAICGQDGGTLDQPSFGAKKYCMEHISTALVIQFVLGFGIAGLLWPEKLKPVLETLMFPWFPTYRVLRNHSVGAILLSVVLLIVFIVRLHFGIQ
jgi:hypothetical protein